MTNWIDKGVTSALNVFDFTQNLMDPSIKLGVTGLSRSGKTVFITSLIYHLLNRQNLPFFEPHASGRIVKAYLQPHPNDLLPRFDYEGNVAKLTASPPSWPEGTRFISQLRLTIEYQTDHFPQRLLGPRTQHIDIIDYPGEWLLDLQLLDKDYATWCQQAFDYASAAHIAKQAEPWLGKTKQIDPNTPADEGQAKKISDSFTRFLQTARASAHDLPTIPPGRFLMPGDLKGSPALTFAPLKLANEQIQPDSLAALMQRRYEAYKEQIVRPFYRKFFTLLDRQIVLVDVLSVLNAGHQHVTHLQTNLGQILNSFNPGKSHWLTSIWNKKIDRLVFAATKADHLHHHNHDQLQNLLSHLTQGAINQAKMQGADVKVQALASLQTTKEVTVEKQGESYNALQGTPVKGEIFQGQTFDGNTPILIFPGDLPDNSRQMIETGKDIPHIDIINFAPPAQDKGQTSLLPHIRLDRALNMLIGDKLT